MTTDSLQQVAESEFHISAFQKYIKGLPDKLLPFGIRLLCCFLLFFIATRLLRVLKKAIRKAMVKAGANEGALSFVNTSVTILCYLLLFFGFMSWFGIDTTGVAALVASAGVAIGLGLQGALSNVAGGLLILVSRPFKLGDYIIVDGSTEGTVKEIQFLYTRLQRPDNTLSIIPNGTLAGASIRNVSAFPDRRLDIQVGIFYGQDVDVVREIILDSLASCPLIRTSYKNEVFISELADSAVVLNVRCYVASADFLHSKAEITELVYKALTKENIGIPYPQMDIHIVNEDQI